MPDRTGFFVVGGTLGGNVHSYVQRPLDDELLQLTLAGEYCNVLAARQMGKSSLMVRTAQKLREHGVRPIIIDITAIGSSVSASEWYFGLLSRLARELKLELDEQEWWRSTEEKSPVQRFSDFLRDIILEKIKEPLVIFIDEIDSTLKLDFTDDFFAAIRAIYNARSRDEIYKRLSFVLLGVARPGDLIKDRTRTPYNIGFNLEVTDFQEKELGAFQQILEKVFPNSGGQVLRWVLDWTGGQPYLTQKLCAELVENNQGNPQKGNIADLVERIFLNDQARTETNLRAIRDRIQTSPHLLEMLAVYKRVLTGRKVTAEERSIAQNELKLTGLVRVSPQGTLQIRNRIYGHVFNADWVRNSIPVNVTNRRRITTISSVAVLAIAAAGFFYYRQANQAIEIQSQTYLEGFNTSTSQEVRITNLAGLIGLGGEYATQAQDLFLSLTYEDRLVLFDLTTPDNVGNELVVVVDGVYQTTENTAEGNALLSAMTTALEGTTAAGSVGLVIEINAWLDGREALGQGQYEVAVASLTTAWERSEQRGHPNLSVLLERAQAYISLEQYDDALSNLDQVLAANGDYAARVTEILNLDDNQAMLDYLRVHSGQFPNVERVVSLPTTIADAISTSTPIPFSPEITDINGDTLLLIPAGEFYKGSSCAEAGCTFDQGGTIETTDAYWIHRTEISNLKYANCVAFGSCTPPYESSLGRITDYYSNPEYYEYPVVNITFEQAQHYCDWISGRLPTNSEWEKAARGIDGRGFPWGFDFNGYESNSCDLHCTDLNMRNPNFNDGYKYTAPVNEFSNFESPYGVINMAGNVQEIVQERNVRGGAWNTAARMLWTFFLGGSDAIPSESTGFRCVMDAP